MRRLALSNNHCAIRWLAVTPDGGRFLTNHTDFTVRLHDLPSGREIHRFQDVLYASNSLAISRDGHWAVSGNSDKTVRIMEVDSGRRIATFYGHTDNVMSVALSRTGRLAASASH